MTGVTVDVSGDDARTAEPEVLLVDVHTDTERALISAWAADTHAGAAVVEHGDPDLAARLDTDDDPLITPARVTWLPAGENGSGGKGPARELVALVRPRRPPAVLQRWIVRRNPARARVTSGEPAHVRDLDREFRAETGGSGGRAAFVKFVARRATLACDRAERLLIGDRYKVPRLVAEQITASAAFRKRVKKLAQHLDRPFADVLEESTGDLQELAAVQSPPAIDAFRATMGLLHRRAWTVDDDVEGLERLRELNRHHSLVFLPSHRSYADPLVLADVLHRHDFPRDHVLGGNNMAFWPIGPLGKRAGLIFIRRSFGHDEVYKLAMRAYFGHLLAKRFNLEWYIEGGRSRTGKLRPPRYGLLSYLVRAMQEGDADDALLVPVSIAYEQLQEVGEMAAQQAGAAKSAEGLGWLAGYIRAQWRDAGVARVRFGDPISLRAALQEAGEGSAHLEKIAFSICVGINAVTPVTATSLVTFALLDVRDRALTLTQVRQVTEPLLDHFETRGIPGPVDDLRQSAALVRTLRALETAGVVDCFAEGTEPVWSIAPERHRVAAFYRNGALHHVINRAIVELALVRVADECIDQRPLDMAWEEALRLRDLLKFEFFFSDKARFRDELVAELDALSWTPAEGLPESRGEIADVIVGATFLFAHGTLRSFIDAQLIVAECLGQTDPGAAIERDAFARKCLAYGQQLLLQGRIHGAESISRELFDGALRLADNRDLVEPGRKDLDAAREAWRLELGDVRDRLMRIAELDATRVEKEVFHDRI